jgi:hypothetical protein
VATYKVLQDIEAEDKLVGPLSLRQFIYGCIAALCGYLIFLLASKGVAFVAVIFIPPMALCAFFAFPWTKDQPTEVWALARIRFLLKPRKRIWNQSGVRELVTVTAPKKIEQNYTNGLTEVEVRSRLSALASTIDSRGWAIKNVNVNLYSQPALVMNEPNSDRLMSASSLPQEVPIVDVQAADDILDERNNPVAARMESKLEASTKARRQHAVEQLAAPEAASSSPAKPNDYWFLNQPGGNATSVSQDAVTFNTQVITPGIAASEAPMIAAAEPSTDEETLIKQLEAQRKAQEGVSTYSHLHTIQPLSEQQAAREASEKARSAALAREQARIRKERAAHPPVPEPPKPAILDTDLVWNNDYSVANIAREAHKRRETPDDEVVISLH